ASSATRSTPRWICCGLVQGARRRKMSAMSALKNLVLMLVFLTPLYAQNVPPPPPIPPPMQLARPQGEAAPPLVMTVQDALDRAKKFDIPLQSAITDAAVAREDRAQAKQSLLPSVIETTQYLGTQGNGTLPSGRYVTNDGVHVYREQGIAHQEISANT